MDIFGIRSNAEMARNSLNGQEETVLEVIPGTHIRVSNALLNPANPLINLNFERHPNDCPPDYPYRCAGPPLAKRARGESISSQRPGHVEFGIPGESLAPAAASEFVTEGFPKYQNRPTEFTTEEFHSCLDQMDAKDLRIKELKKSNEMLDKEVGVLLKFNIEMKGEIKTANAKIELATKMLADEVAKGRKRKFGPEDVGRECFTQKEGGIRIMSIDRCDALSDEMAELKLRAMDLQRKNDKLEKDLRVVTRKNQQVLQVVFKPLPFVTARDTTILRKARSEFVTSRAIGADKSVWVEGTLMSWEEAETKVLEKKNGEIEKLASKKTVFVDDTQFEFDSREATMEAARIATDEDIYG